MKKRQFNIEKLVRGCEQLGISINAVQQAGLLTHIELLAKWNQRLNLTAIDSDDDMISHHILDSLAIQDYLKGNTLLDVGSGGGFPGLPLAIINPDIKVTLLDSRGKRIEFMRFAVSTVGLKNVSLVKSRIEHYQPPEKFDTLAARAFSSFPDLVRSGKNCLADGARLLALKGKYPYTEIEDMNRRYPGVTKNRLTVEKLDVPFLHAQRHLIVMDF